MTNPYTSQTLSGFNSNPPPNDATTGSDNEADWDNQILAKIGTPLKNLAEGINSAVTAAFAVRIANSVASKTSDYTVTSSDNGKFIYYSGSGGVTLTLLAAATAGEGFVFLVQNSSTGIITLDGNGSETINGLTTYSLLPGEFGFLVCTGSAWNLLGLSTKNVLATILNTSISGLTFSNGTDADHDMDFTTGIASDDTNTVIMRLTSALTKQFDATFAEGNNAGGMVSGESLPTSGTVHFWLIQKADGTVDVCGNNNASSGLSPTLPTGFVYKRLIGSWLTDASANFIPMKSVEAGGGALLCLPTATQSNVTNVPITAASGATPTVSAPAGIRVLAKLLVGFLCSTQGTYMNVGRTDETLVASPPQSTVVTNNAGDAGFCAKDVLTDTSGQVAVKVAVDSNYYIATEGFIDFRRT